MQLNIAIEPCFTFMVQFLALERVLQFGYSVEEVLYMGYMCERPVKSAQALKKKGCMAYLNELILLLIHSTYLAIALQVR